MTERGRENSCSPLLLRRGDRGEVLKLYRNVRLYIPRGKIPRTRNGKYCYIQKAENLPQSARIGKRWIDIPEKLYYNTVCYNSAARIRRAEKELRN